MDFFFIGCPLPVIVRRICLFENFEKLSLLLGFLDDILEGWARGCCVHVFLVLFIKPLMQYSSEFKYATKEKGRTCYFQFAGRKLAESMTFSQFD